MWVWDYLFLAKCSHFPFASPRLDWRAISLSLLVRLGHVAINKLNKPSHGPQMGYPSLISLMAGLVDHKVTEIVVETLSCSAAEEPRTSTT